MRRSKSNPAKYARNYRKISQRKMTEQEMDVEKEEIERLKNMLRTSSEHLSNYDQDNSSKKRKRKKTSGEETSKEELECEVEVQDDKQDKVTYSTDDIEMILPSRKKKGPKKKVVELTPEELKAARAKHKAMQRKLNQIEQRHERKKRRKELYATLTEHALSETEMQLMGKSSEVGKKVTKKEMLKKLLQKERAGVELTQEEKEMLYTNTEHDEEAYKAEFGIQNDKVETRDPGTSISHDDEEVVPLAFSSTRKKKQKKKKKKTKQAEMENDENEASDDEKDKKMKDVSSTNKKESIENAESKKPVISFAAQMMAGLTTLKTTATKQKEDLDKKRAKEQAEEEEKKRLKEEEERKNRNVYVPQNPLVVKSAAAMGLKPMEDATGKDAWRVLPVERPDEVNAMRYDLPVNAMEYEIIDSIRNNSVTIICSETGSGKSTQVPQFLYESGVTLGNAKNEGEDDGLLICVTQPRRVAAVSTAKRVCYEMGHSNDKGQTIQGKKGEGNLVAYQTKYETAGLGPKTRVKFMTDGILLQEIKSDLLLRKYAVIILDEIHERGINTDVLLGLLSVSLPLRRKAAAEGSLPPLKLVLMSATLRVEDFTGNGKLFSQDPPNVVNITGRTYPVTIHHSKTTELDDYEKVAFQKVCKIHRKLPKGGILVFLTGKQEIVRMVKRLKKALIPKSERNKDKSRGEADVHVQVADDTTGPRDIDDDEADGDLFENDNVDDFEVEEHDSGIDPIDDDDDDENRPKKVKILPLYSLLSVKDQAKVFEPVEEGTRLIVVSTNIAETSLTIPGISYVVDTGRQKCRNYHAATGVASYDIMWISKASADQRAGRAGRTNAGHCYRTFSSSVYARHLDSFALPEMLTRPLEDVVLAMKSMNITNVAGFPFPTPPDTSQLNAAVSLLANLGCIDTTNVEREGGDGVITKLGAAVSQLPIGVRYGKMLLIAAQGNVLDYGITLVSVLSEASPFAYRNEEKDSDDDESDDEDSTDGLDDIDKHNAMKQDRQKRKERANLWRHDGGDILAGVIANGAYSYAGRGAGGATENLACRKFCEENGLQPVIMQRIQKMRIHLARLAKQRLGNAKGVASSTGKILASMPPPKKVEENLLKQAIVSGLLDNVARRCPQARLGTDGSPVPRSAYFSCRSNITEPLFIDKKSVLFSRDPRQLPEWICYDSVVRKSTKDGSTISTMRNVTPIDPQWLGSLSMGCKLLSVGDPLDIPVPSYDTDRDKIMCSVTTKFGDEGWILPPIQISMKSALESGTKKIQSDDVYRWFARYLLEGKVFNELKDLKDMLNDDPSIITRKKPATKISLIISALSSKNVQSAEDLVDVWTQDDNKFLFKYLKNWVKKDNIPEAKKLWISMVRQRVAG